MTTSNERRAFFAWLGRTIAGAAALACAGPAGAGAPDHPRDVFTGQEIFDRLLTLAREQAWSEQPIGDRIGAIGMALRQTPYVDATLELYEDREVCSVDFRGMDCVTFFEICLGMARLLKRAGHTPEALLEEITLTRYRGGRVTDYASRLHYLSDWFADNADKRVVRILTPELPGAARFTKRIDFMTTHPDAYRQLKNDPEMLGAIARIEKEISAREMFYVHKTKVASAQSLLRTGDIVGVTTTIFGLDCSHSGLCYRDDRGALRFLHGSTNAKQVILDGELTAYLRSMTKNTGIMVARPLEVP